MKKGWFILFVLPVAAFCEHQSKTLFLDVASSEGDVWEHLAYDENESLEYPFEANSPESFDSQELSLLEIDERDVSLTLWSDEKFGCEESAPQMCGNSGYQPSLEQVPESEQQSINLMVLRPSSQN